MKIQRRIYTVSEMMLCLMMNILLVTVLFLVCGISVNAINLIISIILMLFYRYRFFSEGKKYLWVDFIICAVIFIFFLLLSGSVYDQTWDGAAYHKTAVGLLKEGWNPYYSSSAEYNTLSHSIEPARESPLIWAEAYPKASWYFAAVVYKITGSIEYGKCYTLIFTFITFGVCLEFFSKKSIYGIWNVLLSVVASLNPIVCAQFQTYYLDGIVAGIFTMLILKLLALFEEKDEKERKEKFVSVFALMVWGCNLKFNIAFYIATICMIYCICISMKKKKFQKREAFVLASQGAGALFIVGFNPYVTNLMRYGNMFYGFDTLLNEQEFQKTFGIEGLGNMGRFWTSVFGRTSHGQYSSIEEVVKIPFTFCKEELDYYAIPDVRVGGFGIMFSGLFVMATIIGIGVLVNKIRKKTFDISFAFIFLIWSVSLVEFCFVPQTSQFRYIPHLYLCVVFALYELVVGKKRSMKVGAILFGFVIGINLFPWFSTSFMKIQAGLETTGVLKYLEKMCESERIGYEFSFYCNDFTGMIYNLKDHNIRYQYVDLEEMDLEQSSSTYSGWMYYKTRN